MYTINKQARQNPKNKVLWMLQIRRCVINE